MTLMNEKATLLDKIQEIEHLNMQLSDETETIGKEAVLHVHCKTSIQWSVSVKVPRFTPGSGLE